MAVQDPPASVREKGERVTIVFNVPNGKQGSVNAELQQDEDGGSWLTVTFSSVSPSRKWEKQLLLPHATTGRAISNVESKIVTVVVTKAAPEVTWGNEWIKASKKKKKGKPAKAKAALSPTSSPIVTQHPEPEVAEIAQEVEDPEALGYTLMPEPEEATMPELPEAAQEMDETLLPAQNFEAKRSASAEAEQEDTNGEPEAKSKAKKKKKKKAASKSDEAETSEAVQQPTPAVKTKPTPAKQETKSAKTGDSKPEAGKDNPRGNLSALPVLPPADPEIQRLMKEGSEAFTKDRKRALVLLRLAGQKGYLPAYLVIAQLANGVEDNDVLVDALITLLAHETVSQHVSPELLKQCAMQLASALVKNHKCNLTRTREAELDKVAERHPVVAMARLAAASPSPQKAGQKSVSGPGEKQIKGAPQTAASRSKAQWRAEEDGAMWRLEAQVEELQELERASLELSPTELLLSSKPASGPKCVLLQMAIPGVVDVDRAEASWCGSKRRLTVKAPCKARFAPSSRNLAARVHQMD